MLEGILVVVLVRLAQAVQLVGRGVVRAGERVAASLGGEVPVLVASLPPDSVVTDNFSLAPTCSARNCYCRSCSSAQAASSPSSSFLPDWLSWSEVNLLVGFSFSFCEKGDYKYILAQHSWSNRADNLPQLNLD